MAERDQHALGDLADERRKRGIESERDRGLHPLGVGGPGDLRRAIGRSRFDRPRRCQRAGIRERRLEGP